MVDDVHISPKNYKRVVSPDEDDFDCDSEAVVIGGGGGFGPTIHQTNSGGLNQIKHQQSMKGVEETKNAI